MSEHISESIRKSVEKRVKARCEYCKLPSISRLFRFPIDHIVSIKHGGKTVKSNLALACLSCNLHNGSDIASIDPISGELTALYNARLNNWDDHFNLDLRSGKIEGKTPKGCATVQLLQFNTIERIEERVRLMDLVIF